MNSSELLSQFRADVSDEVAPYLWSDTEGYSYIDSAQKQFCRKVGGIGDATSPLTTLNLALGTDWIAISPLILKIREAYLQDGTPVEVLNYEDLPSRRIRFDGKVGRVKILVIGMEPGSVRVYPTSNETNVLKLLVDRLPLKTITEEDQKLEVQDQHKEGLGLWIRHRAYSKQDAETLNKGEAAQLKQDFMQYCAESKAERDRVKHKTRVVAYGGI
jgi:hypothetical protein